MATSAHQGLVPELARRLLDGGPAEPSGLECDDWRALAWTLKDLCYAAWSSEPQRAVRAADVLRGLCVVDRGARPAKARVLQGVDPNVAAEIEALAGWTTGIAQLTRGEMLAATQSFDQAAGLFAQLGQPEHATQTQVPKIMALAMLGQHEQAVACAESTQAQFIAQGDVRAASKVSLNLGSLQLGRDAYAAAARHYREAAVLFARVADHEHSVMADIGLADTLTSMGEFDEALLIYARARMRAGTHGFPVLEAMVEESCALLHLARGTYREALGGFERSRRGYERLAMPQHLAIAEKQLADAYMELRLLPEALALYEQAIGRFEALDAPDELAWTLAQHGRTQALMERPDRAMVSLQRAAELFEGQGADIGKASVSLVRSELALAAGRPAEALELAAAAANAFEHAAMAERQARADVLRARAMLALGHNDAAASLFHAGEQRARGLGLLTIQIQCLTGRGLATLAQGQTGLARADFHMAIELFEEQRRVLPGDEFQRAFLRDHLRPYQEMLRLALDAHARSGQADDARAVLEWQERYRARALGERLAGGDAVEADAAVIAQRARLNWLYRRVQHLQDEASPVGGLVDEIRRTEHDLLERARRNRLSGAPTGVRKADIAQADSGSIIESDAGHKLAHLADPHGERFDSRALCQVMREHEALVEYGVLDDELFATIVTREGVQVKRRLAVWPDVVEAVRSALFQIESLRNGHAPLARHMATLTARANARLQRVYELVWAPLAPSLAMIRRVLVVPHGPLGSLPFGALLDGQRALGRVFELAVVPSARVALHGLRSQPRHARTALIFGESSRLEHAAEEARSVARLFPDARTFVGEAATLATLQALAPQADVVHFACHAQFRADNPMFSALHLHDGALTVEAAQALRLGQSTVVLSACETALAHQGTGDEMVGLVRAFLIAGAARVVASLWPVDDRVTARFMTHFYAALSRDEAPAVALREAQIAIRRDHPHPCHWAAFTLFGGW
jgi:tetratricopeptide (TPR) repeat protein